MVGSHSYSVSLAPQLKDSTTKQPASHRPSRHAAGRGCGATPVAHVGCMHQDGHGDAGTALALKIGLVALQYKCRNRWRGGNTQESINRARGRQGGRPVG